ncbi:MAG: hypothetical protein CSYNP_00134 [Syntrophus sp. SKADARSKE-3]|nr:hypothetical protein [Syntrophus sp. SKADARSKE-3]
MNFVLQEEQQMVFKPPNLERNYCFFSWVNDGKFLS